MIKTTYICNRCSNEFEPIDPNKIVLEIKEFLNPEYDEKKDICPDCHQELINWFQSKSTDIIELAKATTENIIQLRKHGIYGISDDLRGNPKISFQMSESDFMEIAITNNKHYLIITEKRNSDNKYPYEHKLTFGSFSFFCISEKEILSA